MKDALKLFTYVLSFFFLFRFLNVNSKRPSFSLMQFTHPNHGGANNLPANPQQLLSLIIDQRCVEESAFLGHGMRNFVVDATLEVVHLAWWGQSRKCNPTEHISSADGTRAASLELELHVITNTASLMNAAAAASVTTGVATECHLVLPRTCAANLEVIRDACGVAYQVKQSIPIPSAALTRDASTSLFTGAQVDAIRSVVMRDGPSGGWSSHHHASGGSGTAAAGAVDDIHVVLLTTVFDPKQFSARIASALPPLISLASQRVQVTVLYLDHLSKTSASQLSLGPSISVRRFPLILPPRRCISQMIRPVLEQWAASCLTPHDLPVILSVGSRTVHCVASCAVVSTLPRWNLPIDAFPSSTVVSGWSVLENVYQDPTSNVPQLPHSSTSTSSSTTGASHVKHRLRVERCVPRDVVDASALVGECWYLAPVCGMMAQYAGGGEYSTCDGPGWWKALVDATIPSTTSIASNHSVAEQHHRANGSSAAGDRDVLILSSAGGSFFQSVSSSIGLRVHEYVGMFSPDGASMLVRPLAPREVIREPPCSSSQFPLRATESMVNEVRDLLFNDSHETSYSSPAAASASHSYHGDVTSIVGAMYSQVPRRTLQVANHQFHMNGKQQSASAKRAGGSGGSAPHLQPLHRGVAGGGRGGGGLKTFPFSSS
jgi:hypothetical protein